MMPKFLMRRQAGDTIVEVMAAITVLGLALGAAYALSNRSFLTSIHTNDRVKALSLAQGQVEFLKDLGLRGEINNLIAAYPNGQQFCFNDSDGTAVAASSDQYCNGYGPVGQKSIYDIAISFCDGSGGCGQTNVFTVRASWIAGGSGQQNQLKIYYKAQR